MEIEFIARYGNRSETYKPTTEQAEAIMGILESACFVKTLELHDIVNIVFNYFDVDRGKLKLRSRRFKMVYMKHLYYYFARRYCLAPLKDIGNQLGGFDHTTVLHGISRINTDLTYDEKTIYDVAMIDAIIKASKSAIDN